MQTTVRSMRAFRRRCCTVGQFMKVLHVTVCFLCVMTAASINPPGETTPDIEMEVGTNANITCRITDGNSSSIWFSEEESGKQIIQPSKEIIILDAQAAILTIRNASEHMGRYQCMTGKNAIGITKVYVGKPPADVTDFSCKGYDFDYMTCSFTKPRNMINTNYELKLKANLDNYSDRCTLQSTEDEIYTCNITIISNTILISREIYHFNLTGTNSLGSRSQIFTINNYRTVVPAKLDVEITNVTSDSVSLSWRVKKFPFYNTYGLVYRILLEPKGFSSYNANNFDHCISANCSIILTNLKYPHREYTVNVRAKVRTAKDDDAMWSNPFIGTFRTQPRLPDSPPKIPVGSFYIDSIETQLRLYWQQLEEYEENGPGFFYIINELDIIGNVINTKTSNETSVTFPWQHKNKYKFEIRACNSLGQSKNSSQIHVYPIREESFGPQTIATVYHNRTYTLSWKPPVNRTHLVNYTVFWCLSKMESPNQCRGSINFKYLDKHAMNFTTEPQDQTFNLAISANFENGFTGMQWARCSADISSDLMKLEPEATATSATTIKLQWSSENVCPSILQGYNISYCEMLPIEPFLEESENNCWSTKKTVVLLRGQMNIKELSIENLKPYTPYRIEIYMYSKTKVGPNSDALYVYTKEAAPSAPRNLQLNDSSVTSNSAVISWLPPLESNGLIKYYTIWKIKNDTKEHTDSQQLYVNEKESRKKTLAPISFRMESLNSYSHYDVYVTAHTVERSIRSNIISVKTLIGRPTNPRKVSIVDSGDYGVLRWERPEMPSGRVEYYEVAMVAKQKSMDTRLYDEHEKTVFVKDNFCKFIFPACMDYYLKVRAVNVAERHEIDHGTFPNTKVSRRRRGRHTNPEIRASVGGGVQTYDTELSKSNASLVNYHHNERTNLLKPSVENTTENPLKTKNNKRKYDALADNDFHCIDAEPVEDKFARANEELTSLPSSWERTPYMYMRCSEYPLTNVVKIALFMFLLAALLGSVSYWLRRKYNKMKNIDAVLPEELVDHLPNYQLGYHSAKKEPHTEISRSIDCLVNQKDSYDLLTTLCNGTTKSITSLAPINFEGLTDARQNKHLSASPSVNVCSDKKQLLQIADPFAANNTTMDYNSRLPKAAIEEATSAHEDQVTPSTDYIKVGALSSTQSSNCSSVDAPNHDGLQCSTTNGYVEHNALKLMSTQAAVVNGYITLDAMGKPISPTASEPFEPPVYTATECECAIDTESLPEQTTEDFELNDGTHTMEGDGTHTKEPITENVPSVPMSPVNGNNNNNNNLICGYVTQKQLAEFGQILH